MVDMLVSEALIWKGFQLEAMEVILGTDEVNRNATRQSRKCARYGVLALRAVVLSGKTNRTARVRVQEATVARRRPAPWESLQPRCSRRV
jgi:hypothetical protein